MSFTRKIVGNLEFNQEEGEIKHVRTGERLAKFASKFVVINMHKASTDAIAIDSTGVKYQQRAFKAIDELVTHLKKVIMDVYADEPSATDAVVRVGLYCVDDAEWLGYVEYSGDFGFKSFEVSGNVLRQHKEHRITVRIEVMTASATSGATQNIVERIIYFVYDFT